MSGVGNAAAGYQRLDSPLLGGVASTPGRPTAVTGLPGASTLEVKNSQIALVTPHTATAGQSTLPASNYARSIPTIAPQNTSAGFAQYVASMPTATAKAEADVQMLDKLARQYSGGAGQPSATPVNGASAKAGVQSGTLGAPATPPAPPGKPSLTKVDDHTIDTGRYIISGSMNDTASIHVTDKQTNTTLDVFGDPHIKDGAGDHASFKEKALVVNLSDGSTLQFTPTAVKDSHSFVDSLQVTKDGQTDKMTFAGSVGIAENVAAQAPVQAAITMKAGADLNDLKLNTKTRMVGPELTLKEFSHEVDGQSEKVRNMMKSAGNDFDTLDGMADVESLEPGSTASQEALAMAAAAASAYHKPVDYSITGLKKVDDHTVDTGRYLIASGGDNGTGIKVTDKENGSTMAVDAGNRMVLSNGAHISLNSAPVSIMLPDGTNLLLHPDSSNFKGALDSVMISRNGEAHVFNHQDGSMKIGDPAQRATVGNVFGTVIAGGIAPTTITMTTEGDLNQLALNLGENSLHRSVYLRSFDAKIDTSDRAPANAPLDKAGFAHDSVGILAFKPDDIAQLAEKNFQSEVPSLRIENVQGGVSAQAQRVVTPQEALATAKASALYDKTFQEQMSRLRSEHPQSEVPAQVQVKSGG